MSDVKIPTWVRGNAVTVALPLEARVATPEGWRVEPYEPTGAVRVVLTSGFKRYGYIPAVDGNVLTFTVGADVACGCYGVEVLVDGVPLRSFKRHRLHVVESNDELPEAMGSEEFSIGGAVLDAGVFLFAKGDKGDPFVYEDFTEEQLDDLAGRIELTPAELAEIAEKVDLSGYVNGGAYDSQTKRILLTHDNVVVSSIDATAFIKDGMVSGVVVDNGYIVITFNTDAGKEDIRIPVSEVFDASLYYTKKESEARFAGKPFIVTFAETAGELVADKTFAATLAAYNGGAAVYFLIDGAAFPAALMGDNSFVGVFHYANLLLEVYLDDENKAGKNTYTLLTSGGLKTINNESLEGSGNLLLATQAALNNYCPIIEDTRESATQVITGNAPFSELRDGQRILLRLAYENTIRPHLQLTLSDGTQTAEVQIFSVSQLGIDFIRAAHLQPYYLYSLYYDESNNRWLTMIDTNNIPAQFNSSILVNEPTSNVMRLISSRVIRDNIYLKSESDTRYLPQLVEVTATGDVTQALESNKFYKFLNPIDELTLTLVTPTGYGSIVGIYAGKFTASSTWDSLVLPASVEEAAGNDSISVGKRYEFNILDNVIVVKEV